MAIIVSGFTICPLCEKTLQHDDVLIGTSHFVTDPFHSLWRFSDAAMHKSCFLVWGQREEFIQLFNTMMASGQFRLGSNQRMQDDGEIVITGAIDFAPCRGERRRTDIHDAAETGTVADIVALLRENPAQVNARDEAGIRPLHFAVAYNNEDVVEVLIKNGADIHARTDTQQTVIHTACLGGPPGNVQQLLDAGADVHARSRSGETPLHYAAASSDIGVVNLLLVAGADVDARECSGETPLHKAISSRRREALGAIEALMDAGASINAYDALGETALHKAAVSGTTLLLRLLLARGADTAAKDAAGRTPRQVAEASGHTMAIRMIANADKDRRVFQ